MNFSCEKAVGPDRQCDFRVGAVILQQPLDREQITKLLAAGRTDLLRKFVSKKTGRPFEALLKLGDGGKVGFEFPPRKRKAKPDATAKAGAEPRVKLSFEGQQPLGKCPRCGGKVFESETDYLCERSQLDARPCKFKSGKTILGQPVDREQVAKLLAAGKTDLLPGFISRRTGRTFSAWLVMQDKGKVGFEFPERDAAGPA
jgi:DNA topoisomerase-3